MKTLYQQLSKENQMKLNKGLKNYPATLHVLKSAMDKLYYPTEMKITDASALHDAIYPMQLFDLTNFYNLFIND